MKIRERFPDRHLVTKSCPRRLLLTRIFRGQVISMIGNRGRPVKYQCPALHNVPSAVNLPDTKDVPISHRNALKRSLFPYSATPETAGVDGTGAAAGTAGEAGTAAGSAAGVGTEAFAILLPPP